MLFQTEIEDCCFCVFLDVYFRTFLIWKRFTKRLKDYIKSYLPLTFETHQFLQWNFSIKKFLLTIPNYVLLFMFFFT